MPGTFTNFSSISKFACVVHASDADDPICCKIPAALLVSLRMLLKMMNIMDLISRLYSYSMHYSECYNLMNLTKVMFMFFFSFLVDHVILMLYMNVTFLIFTSYFSLVLPKSQDFTQDTFWRLKKTLE